MNYAEPDITKRIKESPLFSDLEQQNSLTPGFDKPPVFPQQVTEAAKRHSATEEKCQCVHSDPYVCAVRRGIARISCICYCHRRPSGDAHEPLSCPPEPKNDAVEQSGVFFVIPGNPVAKPRMTNRDRWFKRPITTRYWEWVNAAKPLIPDIPPWAERVELRVFVEFPKSFSKKKRKMLFGEPNRGRKDIDNFLKAALDTIFQQDCSIYSVSAEKRWEDVRGPRIEVTIK